jgi:hypothetical protein
MEPFARSSDDVARTINNVGSNGTIQTRDALIRDYPEVQWQVQLEG